MTKEDEEQGKATSEEITDETKTEENPPPTDEPKDDLNELVTKIKKGYEEKLAKQKQVYENRLKDREEVITQLLNGEKAVEETSIADLINKKRESYFKKW